MKTLRGTLRTAAGRARQIAQTPALARLVSWLSFFGVLGPALSAATVMFRTQGAKAFIAGLAIFAGCGDRADSTPAAQAASPEGPVVEVAALTKDNARLEKSLDDFLPKDPYIVVDTNKNMIYYKKGDEVIHEALCSTGCDSTLRAADGRVWNFATPKGLFKIKNKIKKPTWVKPDWAFIEEGLPIPSRTHPDRFDETAMGSFAMDFGDGYFIHGTLYRRLLGESITHGCVRVADEDLLPIFEKTKIGTLVYIY
jgi:lipoprotein-anchoring transpeptidase ErfK/SrfK